MLALSLSLSIALSGGGPRSGAGTRVTRSRQGGAAKCLARARSDSDTSTSCTAPGGLSSGFNICLSSSSCPYTTSTPTGPSPLINRRFLLTFCCPDSAFLLSRFFMFPIRCALFFGMFFVFQSPPFVKFYHRKSPIPSDFLLSRLCLFAVPTFSVPYKLCAVFWRVFRVSIPPVR